MRKSQAVWTTRDGRKIRVCDMTDTHLDNTIAMIERISTGTSGNFLPVIELGGEQAQAHFDDMLDSVLNPDEDPEYEEDPITARFPIYPKLVAERERRRMAADRRQFFNPEARHA